MDKEAKHWGKVFLDLLSAGQLPDVRVPFRKNKLQGIWDDSELNLFVRGKYLRRLLDRSCSKPGANCLELCCGPGAVALEAARRGCQVTGVDISAEAIEIGRSYQSRFSDLAKRIQLVVGDLNKIELPAEHYDSVYVWDGLHHVANIERLMKEVRKALKPQGVIAVHDHRSVSESKRKLSFVFSRLLLFFLPTEEGYLSKTMDAFKRFLRLLPVAVIQSPKLSSDIQPCAEDMTHSPFEDVSGENILQSIANEFTIVELEKYLSLPNVPPKIRPDCTARFALVRFVLSIDVLLSWLHVLEPQYFFLIAVKP